MTDTQLTTMNFESFMQSRLLKKDSTQPITHIEFGGEFNNKKYHVTEDDYPEMMKLYYKHVIKPKREHHILERQLTFKSDEKGPCLIDLDFQHSADLKERQYTMEDIDVFINLFLDEISKTFELDDINFHVVVQEKPSPRMITKGERTFLKDGIHISFMVGMESVHQQFIRQEVLKILSAKWKHISSLNTMDDIYDKCIPTGTNCWLAPYSKKKDDVHSYKITKVYSVSYECDSDSWVKMTIVNDPSQVDQYLAQNYKNLFIRNKEIASIVLEKDEATEKIQVFKNKNTKPVNQNNIQAVVSSGNINVGGDENYQIPLSTIRQISNREELEKTLQLFLDYLPQSKHDLLEAYRYTMTLPESYYGSGSYSKWIKVGFALRNIDIYLLIVWLAFSAQSPTFDFNTSVHEICDHWMKFQHHIIGGVRKESIMYWSRSENPEGYQQVREQSIDYYIEKSIESLTLDQLNGKGRNRGCCDYDIATVVYRLKKGYFVSTSIKTNSWYMYKKHYWIKDDSGTSLRNTLSEEIRMLYMEKARDMRNKANQVKTPEGELDIESEKYKLLYAKADILLNISMKLANTHDKNNIMQECRELFYDKDFEKTLDQDRYLLCCENGVIDFRNKTFRKGTPEDYLSKCTKINFREIDEKKDAPMMKEISDYMSKLFPIPELCEYAWNHLASILIGDTAKTQCLHYWNGHGQNGKSMLVKFMQSILGEYVTDLDISFFVHDRPGRGKATPELLSLIGSRMAITAEPSEGEKLNEGPMKQLTSGVDSISYRGLFKEQESFVPQCHSVIMANHFLPVRSTDHGTWRRIVVLSFMSLFTNNPVNDDPDRPYQFKKEDNFEEKFKQWGPLFLAMLTKRAYVNQGSLIPCKLVQEASDEYRKREDVVATFISENIMKVDDKKQRVRKNDLIRSFRDWYDTVHASKAPNKALELSNQMEKIFGPYSTQPAGWIGAVFKTNYTTPPEFVSHVTDSETESISTKNTTET